MDPFEPRLAKRVSYALIVLVVLATAAMVALLSGVDGFNKLSFAVFGVLIVWFCWRQASVSATPDEQGLTVRNLVVTTRLEWADIVAVRFGDRPWVQLDIANGDTLAVMGVQRADGDFARAEAQRLADLVAERSRPNG